MDEYWGRRGWGRGGGRTECRGEHEPEYEPDDDDAPPPQQSRPPADDCVREQNLKRSRRVNRYRGKNGGNGGTDVQSERRSPRALRDRVIVHQLILDPVPLRVAVPDAVQRPGGLEDGLQEVRLDAEDVGDEVDPGGDVEREEVEREPEARRADLPPSSGIRMRHKGESIRQRDRAERIEEGRTDEKSMMKEGKNSTERSTARAGRARVSE